MVLCTLMQQQDNGVLLMTKWQEVKLGDVCLQITDGVHNTVKDDVNGYFYLLSCKNIKNGTIIIGDNERKINKTTLDNLRKRTHTAKGDVLLSSVGTIGETAIIKEDTPLYEFQRSVAIFKPNPQYITSEFLFYSLNNKKKILQYSAEGAVQQCLFINPLKEFEISLPPLEMQKKIAGVLGALDDKIELNNKINNNLEQQAQALFKSWFVEMKSGLKDEKFGCIPDDAQVCKIGDLPVFITDYVANGSFASLKENVTLYQTRNYAYFIRNTDLKANSFEVYVDEHSYKFLAKSSLFGNEIIISNVGDVGSVFLCPKLDLPMTLGNNIIMLRADKDSDLGFYLYVWFKWSYGQELIQGIKGGSAQPKFNKTDFKGLPVILPPKEQLKKFNKLVTPMFDKISQNQQENKQLAALRDTLLPKLMKGEIDVSNVDISALTSTDKLSFSGE